MDWVRIGAVAGRPRRAIEDVPCTERPGVRELPGGRRNNDVIDAAAAASEAALPGLPPRSCSTLIDGVRAVGRAGANLAHRTRLVNQLHALLRELIPGGADTDLTADRAARALATVRPVGPAETVRKQIGRDMVAEIRDLDARLAKLTVQMSKTLTEHGSRLTDVNGIGPIVATRLLGRTGRASRFPTSSAFASYAGVAPVEVASRPGPPPLPRGGTASSTWHAHRRAHPGPHARPHRLASTPQDRRGKTHNGPALPQAAPRRPSADHDPDERQRRRARRTQIGGASATTRWLNPDRLSSESHFPVPPPRSYLGSAAYKHIGPRVCGFSTLEWESEPVTEQDIPRDLRNARRAGWVQAERKKKSKVRLAVGVDCSVARDRRSGRRCEWVRRPRWTPRPTGIDTRSPS